MPISTQLELVLLSRTLESIRSCPGLPIVYFFEELNVHLQQTSELSLSAYWRKVFPDHKNLVSIVEVPREEHGSGDEDQRTIVPNISELDHLRHSKHAEIRHDPLLIIRNLYENAISTLSSANPEERSILLTSCLLLSIKSGRASLLLHTAMLMYIFKNDCAIISPTLIAEFRKKCISLKTEDKQKPIKDPASVLKETTIIFSFGKADHGKNNLTIFVVTVQC